MRYLCSWEEGNISYMSLPKKTEQACKILLESEMVMKILHLKYVYLTWNGPKLKFKYSDIPYLVKNNKRNKNLMEMN
jgi:hypothetical protein